MAPLIFNICSRRLGVGTKDYSWPWGPLSCQFSGYQRLFMALGPIHLPIQWVPKTIHGPGAHSAPNSVGTKDILWPWGPLSPQFSGYQRLFMALGPTQPPIQWVPKTIYGSGAHSAPNSVSTKDNLRPWGPLSSKFGGYQRQFMALGPTQPLIL